MEQAIILSKQILTMGIYMVIGYIMYRKKLITAEGSRSMANILLRLVVPAILLKSFLIEYSAEKLGELGISVLVGGAVLLLSLGVSCLIYKNKPIELIAAAYSNSGFMGIPLVTATVSEGAAFYVIGFLVFFNLTQWSFGASLLKGEKVRLSFKMIYTNPMFIGALIGFILFIAGVGDKIPAPLRAAVNGICELNSPLAMLVLGVYLAQTSIKKMVLSPALYKLSAIRLVLIPVLTMLFLWPLPVDNAIKLTLFIVAAAPIGANITMYAQLYNADYTYACQAVCLSTVLSLPVMPLVTMLAASVFKL